VVVASKGTSRLTAAVGIKTKPQRLLIVWSYQSNFI